MGIRQLDQTALALSASSFAATIMHTTLMFYYVKVFLNLYGITEEWFQITQVLFLVWNAINDPLLGYLVDHVPLSIHKTRRHTILYGAPVFALSFLIPWFPWTSEHGSWLTGLHLLISLCVYDTMFTYVLLTAASLNTEISSKHDERLQRSRYNMVASLIGSVVIFFCEYTSNGLEYFHNFQVCCVLIAVLAWISLTYTGKNCHTQFELQQLNSPGESYINTDVVYTDRSTNYSIWRLTWQLITQRNFITYVTTNLLSEFHRSYLINFTNIFYETLVPQVAVPHFIRSCFYGWLVVLPQIAVILGMPTIGRVGYYRLHMWAFSLKVASGLLMYMIGRQNPWFIMMFMSLESVTCGATVSLMAIPLSDIIDEDMQTYNRKHPQSSMVFGTNALITKPGISLAPMITVRLWKSFGYQQTSLFDKTGNQNLGAPTGNELLQDAMFTWACAVPVLVGFMQYVIMKQYTIRNSHLTTAKYSESV